MEREVDPERDHGDRNDEAEHLVVLESDQVGDALQPDHQCAETCPQHRNGPIGPEDQPGHDQNRQDREPDERSGRCGLLADREVDVDCHAPRLVGALVAAQRRLSVPGELLLRHVVAAQRDGLSATAERLVVGDQRDEERR